MYPPESTFSDQCFIPRAIKWSGEHAKKKALRGNLRAFRAYLDGLTPSQVQLLLFRAFP
jgi:hypothetical protein